MAQNREPSKHDRIAVLGVVIAGVLTTVVEPGIWTWGATLIGGTLLLVLWAYGPPALKDPDDEHRRDSAAYAAACAFSAMLLPGYLLNWLYFTPSSFRDPYSTIQTPVRVWFNWYDIMFLLVWCALAIGSYIFRRGLVGRRLRRMLRKRARQRG